MSESNQKQSTGPVAPRGQITVMVPLEIKEGCFPPREMLLQDGWHIVRTERGEERLRWDTDEDELEGRTEPRWWLVGHWAWNGRSVAPTSLRAETWQYVRPCS